jgi:putative oxidoreductase
MKTKELERFAPHVLGALRMMTALLFIQHGVQKIFGFPPAAYETGPFELWSLTGLAGILELFGGLAVLFGFFTRPVAFFLSGQMAVAYFLFHLAGNMSSRAGFLPIANGGELAIMFSFVFLFLVVAGPGKFSIDGWRTGSNDGDLSSAYS